VFEKFLELYASSLVVDYVYAIVLLKIRIFGVLFTIIWLPKSFDAISIMLSLNAYFDKCLEIIAIFDDFTIQHVSRDENIVVNDLAQQTSDF
jgi:hypothetical protein